MESESNSSDAMEDSESTESDGMEVDDKAESYTDIEKMTDTESDCRDHSSPAATPNPLRANRNSNGDKDDSRAMEEPDTHTKVSDASSSEEGGGTWYPWVSWFCGLPGNELFCKVDRDYIADGFNRRGLRRIIRHYDLALELMMGPTGSVNELAAYLDTKLRKDTTVEAVEKAAKRLYGMIHARFILTDKGLNAMALKYKHYDFGRCPRVHCARQPCLPVGLSNIPRASDVELYCPKCEDHFHPQPEHEGTDGAYFGTVFPHHFLKAFPHLKPQNPPKSYVPRVFGFKIHKA